jgi:glycosyltransferase involved in cell wall biosynthesis
MCPCHEKIDHPDATLNIVDDGDIENELERIVAEEDFEDRVTFTGLVARDRIPEMLDTAAVGIAPSDEMLSLNYAVPTRAYEYMSAKLPVVATGNGEIETLLDESNGGILLEQDPTALARAFDQLLTEAETRKSLGADREHVVEHYDRVVNEQSDDVLRALITR